MTAPAEPLTQTRARRRGRHPIQSANPVGTSPRPLSTIESNNGPKAGGLLPANGVDLGNRETFQEELISTPEHGGSVWRAEGVWTGGLRSSARVRGFSEVAADEPVEFGGTDSEPSPVEALLAALANCLVAGYAGHASAAGIQLRDLRVRVAGELDLAVMLGLEHGHAGYNRISAAVTIRSDATPAQLAELHETVVATSPVGHTIGNVVPIRIHLA